MKTMTRKKSKRVAKKPTGCTAIVVANKKPDYLNIDLCGVCGRADDKGGVWQDPVTQERYIWCRSAKCRKTVQINAPWRVRDRHTMHNCKPISLLAMADILNDIELSADMKKGRDIVRGYSAKLCHDAWAYSVDSRDNLKALKLFKLRPMSKFLIFNEDGKLVNSANSYREADKKRKKREVIVFWRGK